MRNSSSRPVHEHESTVLVPVDCGLHVCVVIMTIPIFFKYFVSFSNRPCPSSRHVGETLSTPYRSHALTT
jgi:hypothetical protein